MLWVTTSFMWVCARTRVHVIKKKKDSICHYPINGYGSLRHHMVMWLPIGPRECLKIKLTFSKYTFYAPPGDGFVQTWVIIFGKWPADRGKGIKLAHILLTKYIKLVKCEFFATAKMSWRTVCGFLVSEFIWKQRMTLELVICTLFVCLNPEN